MDNTGIEIEDIASTKELEILYIPYEILGEKDNAVLITGVALTEGVWKNVIYSAQEIKRVAKSLIGKPLLVEHGKTKEFEGRHVGAVTSSYYEESLKGIVFQAEVTDPLAKRLVKKEVLPAVSCSTWMEKKAINEQIRIGSDYNFSELSLVRVPACDRCFIFHKEQLSMLSKGKDLKEIKETNILEVENMHELEEEIESLSEIEEEELKLVAPKLFAVLELPDEETLTSLKTDRKVVSYFYGNLGKNKYPYKRKENEKNANEKVLLCVVELNSREELDILKETYKIRHAYYGDQPQRLSKGDLAEFKADLEAILKEFTHPREKGDQESIAGKLMPNQTGAPNPEQCQKATCPVCDTQFEDEDKFLSHWEGEHKEKYGGFNETMTILAVLGQVVNLSKGNTKIIKMKNGRFMAMVDTGKTGIGQWKLIGNFATKIEAANALKKPTENAYGEPEKDKHGCIAGKENWDIKTEKCVPIKKKTDEEPEEKPNGEVVCPACKKKFKSEKELAKHWQEVHQEKFGPLKRGYKTPEEKSGVYYYFKLNGNYYPYRYKDGKYYKKYKKE